MFLCLPPVSTCVCKFVNQLVVSVASGIVRHHYLICFSRQRRSKDRWGAGGRGRTDSPRWKPQLMGWCRGYELYMISLKELFWRILRSITAHLSVTSALLWSRRRPRSFKRQSKQFLLSSLLYSPRFSFRVRTRLSVASLSLSLPVYGGLNIRRKHLSSVYWHIMRQYSYRLCGINSASIFLSKFSNKMRNRRQEIRILFMTDTYQMIDAGWEFILALYKVIMCQISSVIIRFESVCRQLMWHNSHSS